ncbi:MAG: YaiI/YqxD family protein, partial [Butyricicoccus sp.]
MTVWVDADACPVVRETERIARRYGIRVVLVCDTNHVLRSETSEIVVVGAGADAVDLALINRCRRGDIVLTQDYGVAALALARGCAAIHQSGMWYTEDNIDGMLFQRHNARKARRASAKHHLHGPQKRTAADGRAFSESLERRNRDNT